MSELNPCPFCNGCDGDPTVYVSNQNGWYVYCKCGARVGYFKTAEFAIAAWNTRAERTCRSTTDDNAWCFVCSECGKSFPRSQLHLAHNHGEINYCPNCGAKVVGE